ncbi:hypothetical protein D3C72_1801650 [compost metagenome]
MVVARVRRQGLLVAGGNGAAAEAVGVIGQDFELGDIVDLPLVLERDVLAPATEVVVIAVGLERVVIVLRLGQAAGHVGLGVVVVKVQRQVVALGQCPVGLEQDVVDIVVVVAFAIAIAIHAGIQQRNAQAIVGGAADEH